MKFDPISSLTLQNRLNPPKRARQRLNSSMRGFIVAYYSEKGYTYLWYTKSPERLHAYLSEREGKALETITIIPSNNTREEIQRLYKIFEKKINEKSFWLKLDQSDLDWLNSLWGK